MTSFAPPHDAWRRAFSGARTLLWVLLFAHLMVLVTAVVIAVFVMPSTADKAHYWMNVRGYYQVAQPIDPPAPINATAPKP